MTFTIAYAIYNKGYMIDEIIDGLVYSMRGDIKYRFILDGCTDNSREVLEKEIAKLANAEYTETDDIFELATSNIFLREFDTDFLVIFQDDMVMRDKNFISNVENVYSAYGDELGLLGCRDGFDAGYSNMCGSRFSASRGRKILEPGDYCERMMVNTGPIIFMRRLLERVGYLDDIYTKGTYDDMDYSLRCYEAGLKNIVMGVDMIHDKFLYKHSGGKHTSQDVLSDMLRINGKIFKDRWFDIAGI